MVAEKTRKIRTHQKQQTQFKPKRPHKASGKTPRTTQTIPGNAQRQHLTLYDWSLVIAFADEHPDWEQQQICDYWRTRKEGALKFSQSALSKKLKPEARAQLLEQAKSHPSAMAGKKACIVTRPDVERCVYLWQQGMERKGEIVTGAMLIEVRKRFEEKLGVLENERLKGSNRTGAMAKLHLQTWMLSCPSRRQ
jgi:hypothetical protein